MDNDPDVGGTVAPFAITRRDEFRRAWRPLVASIVGVLCSIISITFYTQSVFLGPVTAEFGWQRGDVQLGFAIMMLSTIVTSPLVGAIVDRVGARPVALAGLIGHALAYMALSFVTESLLAYYVLWAMVAVLAAGTLPVTWTTRRERLVRQGARPRDRPDDERHRHLRVPGTRPTPRG